MVKVAPKIYQNDVIMHSKGKPILYVQIKKALNVILCRELLFYRKLVKDLEEYGLQINPYNPCVAKKMINKKRMMVVWNVDNLKVSHVKSFETNKFSGYLSIIYGRLTVNRGKVHDYLVIDLDYSKQVTVKVSMIK